MGTPYTAEGKYQANCDDFVGEYECYSAGQYGYYDYECYFVDRSNFDVNFDIPHVQEIFSDIFPAG